MAFRADPAVPAIAFALMLGLTLLAVPAGTATTRGRFDRPPYYHGTAPASARPVAHVALSFRDEPGSLDPTPSRSPAIAALLDSLRAEVDRLGLTRPLAAGDEALSKGPDIRFGVRRGGIGDDGLPLASGEIDTREPRRMEFEVEDPGRSWKERVTRAAGDSVRAILVLQLGFDEYWVRQTSWKGSKAMEIGTGRTMPVPWLTSLDDPVQVLHLTGAIVTPAGRVLRVGAEGITARRTGMRASVLGAQEVLTGEDLTAIATSQWQSALKALVEGLLAR